VPKAKGMEVNISKGPKSDVRVVSKRIFE